jgi:hypothetical protein
MPHLLLAKKHAMGYVISIQEPILVKSGIFRLQELASPLHLC